MSFVKELLSFLIMMHIVLTVCQPSKSFGFRLCDLMKAENICVHLFAEVPKAYREETLEPLDGITFPVGNTSDPKTRESMCAINYYLKNQLPELNKSPALNHSGIRDNVKAFQGWFQKQVRKTFYNEPVDLEGCKRQTPTLSDYAKKEFVLRIIYFSRKWTEKFLDLETCNIT